MRHRAWRVHFCDEDDDEGNGSDGHGWDGDWDEGNGHGWDGDWGHGWDDEGNGHAFRGAVPDDDWDGQVGDGERRDWVDGCVAGCWLGFILGAATAMAGMAWWVYGVPAS